VFALSPTELIAADFKVLRVWSLFEGIGRRLSFCCRTIKRRTQFDVCLKVDLDFLAIRRITKFHKPARKMTGS
jgi:hypothetical protein